LIDGGPTYVILRNIKKNMGLDGTFIPAQAQGIDADWPGYEKGGEEISKLKMNANLALFFFANEAENDLDLDSD